MPDVKNVSHYQRVIELDRASGEPFCVFEKFGENMMNLKRANPPFLSIENDAIQGFWILCRRVPETTGSKEHRQLVFINFLGIRFIEFHTFLRPTGDIVLAVP
jgi:hypothetical protein